MKTCKRFLSVLLAVLLLVCAVPVMNLGIEVSAYSTPVSVDYATATGRLHELVNILGDGSYFNTTRSTDCGEKSSGHGCTYCDNRNIIQQTWFKNLFGSVSTDQFPQTYYIGGEAHARAGRSCFGFGAFAEWYIFKTNQDDRVDTSYIGTYTLTYDNCANNVKPGDLLRIADTHSVIAYEATSNGLKVVDCNGTGSYNCQVHYRTLSYSGKSFAISRATNASETSANVDLGNDFYASILKYDGWATIGYSSENDNVQIVPAAGQASEYWHFVRDEDGSYAIYNCSNNLALEVCGSGTENGTNVNVWPDWGGANQRWYIKGRWNGEFYLCPKNTDKVLDVDASLGTNVQIWEKNEGASQKLSIYITTPKASFYGNHVDIGDDFYANILKYDGWATIGYSSENDNVQIVPATGQASEFWHFVKDADGAYAIYNCSNNLALEVSGSGTENGTNVNVLTDWGGANQRWFVSGPWNGEYYLTPKNTDKVLDVDASLGTNLQIWEKNDTSAQKFSIYGQPKAGVSTLSVTTANGRADFSWTEASNADSYNIRIKNTVTGDTVDIYKETGSSKTVYLESGQYVAYIDSCNVYSFTKSNEVSFTIVHTHSYNSAVTTPATCSSTGIRTYTCTCGDSYTETIGKNSNNHINTTNVGATDSSCTVKGYSAGVYCNDCKQYISGHDEQPLAAHQTTVINAREATYDADGYTGDTYCTVCKQTLSYGSSIPKLTKPEEPTNPTNPTNPTQPTTQQQQQSGNCKYCGGTHTGFPGIIIGFFHSILALFGLHK